MKNTLRLRASLLSSVLILCFASLGWTQAPAAAPKPKVAIMPLSEIKIGMRGTAYTVFQGTKPEPMEAEILGILKNGMGPKSNIILARMHGEKVEYTGVVAGMSGSPVYID